MEHLTQQITVLDLGTQTVASKQWTCLLSLQYLLERQGATYEAYSHLFLWLFEMYVAFF